MNALNIVGFLIEKGYTNYDPIVPYFVRKHVYVDMGILRGIYHVPPKQSAIALAD